MFTPRGHQHMSCWPCWSWRRSHCRWPGPAGSAGAVQSVQPQQGWRWAHCPPRMLHHEEMLAPVPPPQLPACQLVSQLCWREGRRQIKHRSPALGAQQRRAGTLKPLHYILMDPGPADRAFRCSRSRAKPESRLQNPAALHRLSKLGQTPAPRTGQPFSRAAGQQQFLRTLQKLQTFQRLLKERDASLH